MAETYFLGLGSNLGDRKAKITRALQLIGELGPTISSSYHESEPAGFDSPNRFLNIVAALTTPLSPLALLDRLQEIERAVDPHPHRDSTGAYIDRGIDIDIICTLSGRTHTSPRLVIPHPRAAGRSFVTGPLEEVKNMLTNRLSGTNG